MAGVFFYLMWSNKTGAFLHSLNPMLFEDYILQYIMSKIIRILKRLSFFSKLKIEKLFINKQTFFF